MDSFFAKKGLTLSRNNNTSAQSTREQLLRSQQQNAIRPPTHPAPTTIHSLEKHSLQNTLSKPNNHSQIIPHSSTREEKSFSIGANIRLMSHRQAEAHPPLSKQQNQFKFAPTFNVPPPPKPKQNSLNSSRQQPKQLSKLSMIDHSNRSFEQNFSMVERQSSGGRGDTYSEVKSVSKLKMTLEAHRMQTESAKINKNMGYLQGSPARSKESEGRASIQPENYSDSILNERIALLQRQKDDLLQELRKRDGKYIPQEWFQEKYTLLKEINEKTVAIRDLQSKLASTERQLKGKISTLQFQVRMLQDSKNRLETQNQGSRKQLRIQKEKNEKAKQEINKLIFFEDDLIHAKDYSHLKQELQNVLTENALMFQEHQQYIITVTESRRAMANRLEEVEDQLNALKKEYSLHRAKLEAVANNSDDKMQLIKLQNDLNFLRKKVEEHTEIIIQKEKELEEAKIALKEMAAQQEQRSQTSQKFMDETNMQQIKETIATYEARLSQLAEMLAAKTEQVEIQKISLEKLTGQLRTAKEERHISNMKQRSSENSLRNEVETLQRALLGEQQISCKRTANLQQSLQRKTREINQKDAFIKNFLLSRVKQIQSLQAEAILQAVKQYFVGDASQ